MVLSIIFWLLIGAATAYFAQQRGRDPFMWFLIGIFLGLLGLLLLFLLPVTDKTPESVSGGADRPLQPQEPSKEAVLSVKNHDYLIRDWFYLDAEVKQQGPMTFDGLKRLWQEGKVGPDSFVWCDGMEGWKKIEELLDLKEGLVENIYPTSS